MADEETLLGSSSVYLFGRPLSDVILRGGDFHGTNKIGAPPLGANGFLRQQVSHVENKRPTACLARIFSFAYEGCLYDLNRPAIFLVHGAGQDPDDPPPTNEAGKAEYDRLSRSPGSSARSGLGMQNGSFSKDIRVWVYDKGDFSMRLEVETGSFNDILLAAEAEADGLAGGGFGRSSGGRSSGAMGRSSGAMGRSSGAMGRSSGWMSRPRDE